jgi:Ser/Thr protein kinase RdoA (MazF antagonist)
MEPNSPIPTLRSIISPEALVALVEAAYGLKITRIQLIKAILLDTYRLWTNQGPYILRVYPHRRRNRPDIEAELEFLAYLQTQGLSVSVTVAGVNGEHLLTLQAPEGRRYAALFTYAPGELLGENLTAIHRYGYTLARLHALADVWPSPPPRTPLDLDYLLDGPLEQLARFEERRHDWTFLHEVAERIRPQLAALPTSAPFYGYCHGDAGPNNAHVTAEGQLTLFDFDFCGPGWRAYDLATFSSGESAEVVEAFLAGYEEVRPLSPEELKALPLFQIAQSIWLLGLRASYINEWGELYFANWFIDRVLAGIKSILETAKF